MTNAAQEKPAQRKRKVIYSARPEGRYARKDHSFYGQYVVNNYKARPIKTVGGFR